MTKMKQFSAYMKARAAFEGVEWKLTDDFLQRHFDLGTRVFFGVDIGENGDLLCDTQQPDFFSRYQRDGRS